MAGREEKLARKAERQIVATTVQSFAGPLLPPEMLARYNDVIPNGAERIMAMAEEQQKHRHRLELKVVTSNSLDQRLGLFFGFIILAGVAASGVWLVVQGKDVSGAAALVAAVAGPTTAFIYGRRKQSAERASKS